VSIGVEFEPIELGAPARRRMATAVAASTAVHVLALAAILLARPPSVTRPVIVLPVSLVSLPGRGDGGGGGEPAAAPSPSPAAEPAPVETPAPIPAPVPTLARPAPVAKPKHATPPKPAPSAVAATRPSEASGGSAATASVGTGEGTGGPGPGAGTGGGLGSGGASPAYGVNPEPPYPIAARRMGLQGTVVLRVVVGADGRPLDVSIVQSSGHAILDTSAADTVRSRWRFVPARRDGIPIEDTVQVPIRFHQTAG
jgi:protein TonB